MTKYWGGKYRIGKDISLVMLKEIEQSSGEYKAYWEPFVGMGGVMRHMVRPMRILGATVYGTDLNPALIAMWQYIKKGNNFNFAVHLKEKELQRLKETKQACSALHGFVGHSCGYFGIYFSGRLKFPDWQKSLLSAVKRIELIRPEMTYPQYANVDFFKIASVYTPRNTIVYLDPPYKMDLQATKAQVWAVESKFSNQEFWNIAERWSDPRLGNLVFVSETQAPPHWKCIWAKIAKNGVPQTHQPLQRVEKLFCYAK